MHHQSVYDDGEFRGYVEGPDDLADEELCLVHDCDSMVGGNRI